MKKKASKRPSRPRSPKLVGVVWHDAVGSLQAKGLIPMPAITFGFLIADEEDFVRVAGEIFADGDHRNETVIPRGMVQAIISRPMRLPAVFEGWHTKVPAD